MFIKDMEQMPGADVQFPKEERETLQKIIAVTADQEIKQSQQWGKKPKLNKDPSHSCEEIQRGNMSLGHKKLKQGSRDRLKGY